MRTAPTSKGAHSHVIWVRTIDFNQCLCKLCCCDLFTNSRNGEKLIKCGQCNEWAFQDCTDFEGDTFTCDMNFLWTIDFNFCMRCCDLFTCGL